MHKVRKKMGNVPRMLSKIEVIHIFCVLLSSSKIKQGCDIVQGIRDQRLEIRITGHGVNIRGLGKSH